VFFRCSGLKTRRSSRVWIGDPVAFSRMRPMRMYPVLLYDQPVPGAKTGGFAVAIATSSWGDQYR
jgi:hypothetical protein